MVFFSHNIATGRNIIWGILEMSYTTELAYICPVDLTMFVTAIKTSEKVQGDTRSSFRFINGVGLEWGWGQQGIVVRRFMVYLGPALRLQKISTEQIVTVLFAQGWHAGERARAGTFFSSVCVFVIHATWPTQPRTIELSHIIQEK